MKAKNIPKPYFAKFLPVEGEMAPNEKFIHTLVNGIQTNNDITPIKSHPDYKKVRLFLCSRDIKIGDKVFDKDDLNYPLWFNGTGKNDPELGEYLTEDKMYTYRNVSSTFKVIGEISPDAKWVKEGDGFQEEGIDFVITVSDEDYEKPAIEQKPFYMIKCPTCETFH